MISVELSKRFKKIVRNAGRERKVLNAIKLVCDGFGNPHIHSGLSSRKLGKNLFGCRTDLKLRLVFEADKNVLLFDFAGDHGEVQNYLRGKR